MPDEVPEDSLLLRTIRREGEHGPVDSLAQSLISLPSFIYSEEFLKELFIVSDASVTDEGSLGVSSPEWLYTDSVSIPGESPLVKLVIPNIETIL